MPAEARTPAPLHIETRDITLNVPTQRHGTLSFPGLITVIGHFTCTLTVPMFPEITYSTEDTPNDLAEGRAWIAQEIATQLDRHGSLYWRRRGVL